MSVDLPPFLLVCDVAPIGPDHLPAHAHADTLSFELSFKGRRVFVNSGTSEYGLSAERQRQRGTAAHNTLVLDEENSSEVWAGFRVARRARARLLDARAPRIRRSQSRASTMAIGACAAGTCIGARWTLSAQELLIEIRRGPLSQRQMLLSPASRNPGAARAGPELQLPRLAAASRLEMHFEGAASVDVVDSTWHPSSASRWPAAASWRGSAGRAWRPGFAGAA